MLALLCLSCSQGPSAWLIAEHFCGSKLIIVNPNLPLAGALLLGTDCAYREQSGTPLPTLPGMLLSPQCVCGLHGCMTMNSGHSRQLINNEQLHQSVQVQGGGYTPIYIYLYTYTCVYTDSLMFMSTLSLKLRQAHGEIPCYLHEMNEYTLY